MIAKVSYCVIYVWERELDWMSIWRKWPQNGKFGKRHNRIKKLSKSQTINLNNSMPKRVIIEFSWKQKTHKQTNKQTKVRAARENWNINLEDTHSNPRWFLIWNRGGKKAVAQHYSSCERKNLRPEFSVKKKKKFFRN